MKIDFPNLKITFRRKRRLIFLTEKSGLDIWYTKYNTQERSPEACRNLSPQFLKMVIKVEKIEAPMSLSEMAYNTLKQSLLATDISQMPDNGRLDERELADTLGVSRTPLREAINRLSIEGFLKVVPRKGIFVVKKSKKEIIEILLVRSALECMAARLATQHITDKEIARMKKIFSPFDSKNLENQFLKYSDANVEFHELVLNISQCGKLIEMANTIFDHIRWIRFKSAAFEERLTRIHKEHLEIIDALEKRDPKLAEQRMRSHIEDLAQYIENKEDFLP